MARVGERRCRPNRTNASGTRSEGGWFSTTARDPTVLLRLKEDYDGAEPSASSISVLNLLTLVHLVPESRGAGEGGADAEPSGAADRRGGPRRAHDARRAVHLAPPLQPDCDRWRFAQGADTRRCSASSRSHYLPFGLVIPVDPGATQQALSQHLDFIGAMTRGRWRGRVRLPRLHVPAAGEQSRGPEALLAAGA